MISRMPIIHFLPFEVRHEAEKRSFAPKNEDKSAGAAVQGGKVPPQQAAERGARQPSRGRRESKRVSIGQPQRRDQGGTQKDSSTGFDQGVDDGLQGEEDTDLENPARYLCPVYKTSSRAGALSTTGQSTNYILSVSLPINPAEYSAEHWTLRGTAMLTMLDD